MKYLRGLMMLTAIIAVAGTSVNATTEGLKTLTRTEDFVVVQGSELPLMEGAETASVRLYACHNSECVPVPMQVDKVDSTGRYVFPQEVNNNRDGNRIDHNDEVVFMAEDAGDSAPISWLSRLGKRSMIIQIEDPVDGGMAWLYMTEEPGLPGPAYDDYVSYKVDGKKVTIESPQFIGGYRSDRISYDVMKTTTSEGVIGPDLLDRQRMGLEAVMKGDVALPVNVPESIVGISDIGIIDGPVRVIVDEIVMVDIGAMSFQWGTEYFVKFYRCGQQNSVSYEFPISPNQLFKTVLMYWSLDFNDDVIGMEYISQASPVPFNITDDVRNDPPANGENFWWGIYGDQGAILQALYVEDELKEETTCRPRWKQDPRAKLRDGDQAGRIEIGFECSETGKMPDDMEMSVYNYILFAKEPTREGLENLRKIFEEPLMVETAPVHEMRSVTGNLMD